jgi:hypothetical protein
MDEFIRAIHATALGSLSATAASANRPMQLTRFQVAAIDDDGELPQRAARAVKRHHARDLPRVAHAPGWIHATDRKKPVWDRMASLDAILPQHRLVTKLYSYLILSTK